MHRWVNKKTREEGLNRLCGWNIKHSDKPLTVGQNKASRGHRNESSLSLEALLGNWYRHIWSHFWYKHMEALDSLAPKANKPNFPITPWLRFSTGSYSLCREIKSGNQCLIMARHLLPLPLSLLHLLNNDIWRRDGTQLQRHLKVFQRQTDLISARCGETQPFLTVVFHQTSCCIARVPLFSTSSICVGFLPSPLLQPFPRASA